MRELLRTHWPVVVVPLLAVAAFLPGIDAPFYMDDRASIVHNPHIRHLWPPAELFSVPLWTGWPTVSSRPILSASFALNLAALGDEPWSFRIANILLHAIGGVLVFGIVRRTLAAVVRDSKRTGWPSARCVGVAFVVAALWVVHPLHTETVTYIVQRAEGLMGFFYLLTVYAAMRAMTTQRAARHAWTVVAVTSCALGMGTKEVMIGCPVFVFLLDGIAVSRSYSRAVRKNWRLHGLLALCWVPLAGLILYTGPSTTIDAGYVTPWEYALTQPGVLLFYLRLSAWPEPVLLDYNWPVAHGMGGQVLPIALVVALVLGACYAVFSKRWWGLPMAWFFGILAPTSSFLPMVTNDCAVAHRLYLPLAGVLSLLVVSSAAVARRFRAPRPLCVCLTSTVVLAFLVMTVRANLRLRDPVEYWSYNVREAPRSWEAKWELGRALLEEGRPAARAIELFDAGIEAVQGVRGYRPWVERLRTARFLAQAKHDREALEFLLLAYADAPDSITVNNDLGLVYMHLGRPADAIPHFETVRDKEPRDPKILANLAAAYLDAGRLAAAEDTLRQATRHAPDDAQSHFALANVLLKRNRPVEALSSYALAHRLMPHRSDVCINAASAASVAGRIREAKGWLERAATLDPANPLIGRNIEKLERFIRNRGPRASPVGSSRVDLQACKLEYSIVSPK